jgi:hypothetical protein
MVVLHFHLDRVGAGCATFTPPVSFPFVSFRPDYLFSYPQIFLKSQIVINAYNSYTRDQTLITASPLTFRFQPETYKGTSKDKTVGWGVRDWAYENDYPSI